MKKIPQCSGLPFIGNLLDFKDNRLALYGRIYRECGELGGYSLGALKFALINSAPLVQKVLLENHQSFGRSPAMVMMKPILGNGLLTSDNAHNNRQRRIIGQAFHPERFPAYGNIIAEQTEQAAQRWQDGQPVDLTAELMRLTLSIIGKTLFSSDIFRDAPDLVDAITAFLQYTDARLSFMLPVPITWPLPFNRDLQRAIRELDAIVYRMIRERRQGLSQGDDLLTLLLEEDGSDQQIRDEIITLLFAGHETTANALSWTFYLLDRHPDVQEKLRAEVTHALDGRTPRYQDLQNLPYALQVLKEAMRLYPPAYAFGRTALEDMSLDGYHLPKDTTVIVSPYILHRRNDYFENAEKFDPDRFGPARERTIPPFAYLPFGAGPRACIGKQFALMEGQLILAALAQSCRFRLLNGDVIEPKPMITLRPSKNIQALVEKVEKSYAKNTLPVEANSAESLMA